MAQRVLRGLTWGHRRAIAPLVATAEAYGRQVPDIEVTWEARTLAQFEHQSPVQAFADYDLVIFDHPHLGSIVAGGLLRPLNHIGTVDRYIGQSLASYATDDRQWAVPVDAATIHAVYRPDLMRRLDFELPGDWEEAIEMMERVRSAGYRAIVAARHHHALLTVASLCASFGAPWNAVEGQMVLDRPVLAEAIEMFDRALDVADRAGSLGADAIDVHEQLARRSDTVYCPAAYGYATYGEVGIWPHRLAFAPFPGVGEDVVAGTAIGGAGAGMTSGCREVEAATAYLRFLSDERVQCGIVAAASGQPARIEAWQDATIDARFNGFFSATRTTIGRAWMRPRFAGYSRIEEDLARLLSGHLLGGPSQLETVEAMYTRARSGA